MKLKPAPRGGGCSTTASLTFAAPTLRRCPPFRNRISEQHSPHLWTRCVRVGLRRQAALAVRMARSEPASVICVPVDPSAN